MEMTIRFPLSLPWAALHLQLEGGGLGGRDSGSILRCALIRETHLLTLQKPVCWKNTRKTVWFPLCVSTCCRIEL